MIRVMTVNLLNGAADPASLAEAISALSPDVVAAQELGGAAAEVLAESFRYGLVEPADDHRGRALVSHRPLEVSDLSLPYRSGLRAILEVDGTDAELLSVHLANPIDPPRGRLRERRRQLEALEKILVPVRPVILVGDFNSTPLWPAYRRLRRHLDDVVASWAGAAGTSPPRTWGYRPWWPAVLRIDHVFAHGFTASGVTVRRIRGTDHRAVTADLVPTPLPPAGDVSPR